MRRVTSLIVVASVLGLLAVVPAEAKPRAARTAKQHKREDTRVAVSETRRKGQSVGAPWAGTLQNPSKLNLKKGVKIRRPYRAFGAKNTVELTRRAIVDTLDMFPPTHELAIGDISAEHGGQVSDHHSHQSGRDVDIGLFYKKKPPGYPDSFDTATEKNLDCARTYALIRNFARSQYDDGGIQVIYLDYDVQGILVRWAKKKGISDKLIERLFQYAHGPGASGGLVHHYRNHANHLHVRFRCREADKQCH